MSRTSYTLSSIQTEISKLGLSKEEITRVKTIFEDPLVANKLLTSFEDPLVAQKFIEGFETPVFRETFYENPLVAIEKLTERTKVTNVGLGERTR